jgi:hypothetical protein
VEKVLVYDGFLTELKPVYGPMPDGNDAIEEDRKENVVVKAREVRNPGTVNQNLLIQGLIQTNKTKVCII